MWPPWAPWADIAAETVRARRDLSLVLAATALDARFRSLLVRDRHLAERAKLAVDPKAIAALREAVSAGHVGSTAAVDDPDICPEKPKGWPPGVPWPPRRRGLEDLLEPQVPISRDLAVLLQTLATNPEFRERFARDPGFAVEAGFRVEPAVTRALHTAVTAGQVAAKETVRLA